MLLLLFSILFFTVSRLVGASGISVFLSEFMLKTILKHLNFDSKSEIDN